MEIQSIRVNSTNGLIEQLDLENGTILLRSSGFEVGDWISFASQEKMSGTRSKVKITSILFDEKRVECTFDVKLASGRLTVSTTETVKSGKLCRCYKVRAVSDCLLGDFVMRLSLPSNQWISAHIEDQHLSFQNSNKYYQKDTEIVWLLSEAGTMLESSAHYSHSDQRVRECSYVRDEPSGNWIIHHRIVAHSDFADIFVGRFRNLTFTSRKILAPSSGWLQRFLLERNERIGVKSALAFLGTIQTQACIELFSGEEFEISSTLIVSA